MQSSIKEKFESHFFFFFTNNIPFKGLDLDVVIIGMQT